MTLHLPRVDEETAGEARFIRPRDPDDHAQFEWLLPRMTPLFVYELKLPEDNPNGGDYVRWSLPIQVAQEIGWDLGLPCACCGSVNPIRGEHAYAVDTKLSEIDWWFKEGLQVSANA
jgi:hypothetical protein